MSNIVMFPRKIDPVTDIYEHFECGGSLDAQSWMRFCDVMLDKPYNTMFRHNSVDMAQCIAIAELVVPEDATWSFARIHPDYAYGHGRYLFSIAFEKDNETRGAAASASTMEQACIRTLLRFKMAAGDAERPAAEGGIAG